MGVRSRFGHLREHYQGSPSAYGISIVRNKFTGSQFSAQPSEFKSLDQNQPCGCGTTIIWPIIAGDRRSTWFPPHPYLAVAIAGGRRSTWLPTSPYLAVAITGGRRSTWFPPHPYFAVAITGGRRSTWLPICPKIPAHNARLSQFDIGYPNSLNTIQMSTVWLLLLVPLTSITDSGLRPSRFRRKSHAVPAHVVQRSGDVEHSAGA